MAQNVAILLIAMAKPMPLNPHQGAKGIPIPTQPRAQRTMERLNGLSRSTPVSYCPDIIRHTPTAGASRQGRAPRQEGGITNRGEGAVPSAAMGQHRVCCTGADYLGSSG